MHTNICKDSAVSHLYLQYLGLNILCFCANLLIAYDLTNDTVVRSHFGAVCRAELKALSNEYKFNLKVFFCANVYLLFGLFNNAKDIYDPQMDK